MRCALYPFCGPKLFLVFEENGTNVTIAGRRLDVWSFSVVGLVARIVMIKCRIRSWCDAIDGQRWLN